MSTKRKAEAAEESEVAAKRVRRDDEAETEEWEVDSEASAVFSHAPSVAETSMTSRSSSKRPKKYVCEYEGCGKAFDRPVRLEIHTRSHTNHRPYACDHDDCGKTFLRLEHLKRHMVDKHSDERLHVCTYDLGDRRPCGKTFTTATRLRRHVAAHEAKEDLTCTEPGCGKVFRKMDTLQRHIRQDHLHEKAFRCHHVDVRADGQTIECDKAFSKAVQLKNHMALDHSGEVYICDICTPPEEQLDSDNCMPEDYIGFPTYAELQDHLRTVHPPTCSACGKQCPTIRALKAHMDIDHAALSDRPQHPCDWPGCDRRFTKPGNLKVHRQTVHVKARNFVCGTTDLSHDPRTPGWSNAQGCGHAFSTKQSLEEHIRTQHLGVAGKPKPCRLNKPAMTTTKKNKPKRQNPTTTTLENVNDDTTLSLLTGAGYESRRPIPCLVRDCPYRFFRDHHLATHLDLHHGMEIDDVHEWMAEKAALEGDEFWIGGAGVGAQGEDEGERELRARLEDVLMERPAQLFEGEGMVIDPALTMES
ncbi:transcription factor IIIA-like [Teratosphaeria destructans]|uniref:Transcription factor IIIA-like n=1 Tax=Teratosphaeria destructans TaxID=418781 RepID=A0A9W7SLT0_9PEZI|nr:transcription factor IIIA-like [Teratosphaeria destructans]